MDAHQSLSQGDDRLELSRSWLKTRFLGITPSDLEDRVIFCCMADVEPPNLFEGIWRTCVCQGADAEDAELRPIIHRVCYEDGDDTTAVIVCDLLDEVQTARLDKVMEAFHSHDEGPPIIIMQHSVAPEHRRGELGSLSRAAAQRKDCAEGMLLTQPAGLKLALAIRSKIHQCSVVIDEFIRRAEENRENVERADQLRSKISRMLWEYAAPKLISDLPPVHPMLQQGSHPNIPGYILGKSLGRGSCGQVYSVRPAGSSLTDANIAWEVVKSVDKAQFADVAGLRPLKTMTQVMKRLSTAQCRHPRIITMYGVMQSPTHILFRMQYGGSQNLYQVLLARDRGNGTPLPVCEFKSIIMQAVDGLKHLHNIAQIAHRDIKPENCTIDINDKQVTLMLTDFDCSIVLLNGGECKHAVGTVPFVAPEVVLESVYNAFFADVWSMGIVMFEIVCGTRVLEKHLGFKASVYKDTKELTSDDSPVLAIRNHFAQPENATSTLRECCRPDMTVLLEAMEPIFGGVLQVNASKRWLTSIFAAAVEARLRETAC